MPRIDIEVFAHLAPIEGVERDMQRQLQRAGRDAGRNFSTEFQREVNQGVNLNALTRDMERLTTARRAFSDGERKFVNDTGSVEAAYRRRTAAIREHERALRDAERRSGGRSGGGGRGGRGFGNGLGNMFGSIPFVPSGPPGAVIGTGLVTGLGAIAEAVTTASQALWLLPAATAAAGAGFATLKIGFSGFDKALKDMGDTKKFAQDLQGLAPSAQQAALEIQHLVGGLSGFKKSVQDSLFSGVAPQLHNLANAFLPELRSMFTGIGGAFNQMFSGAIGQLTTGSRAGVNALMQNIVNGFQSLAPVMPPIVDAMVRLAQVGSSFLPGFGNAIADAAKHFDEFIAHAQQTGQLQHWITQGISAAKELGHWIGDLAHKFYDVFGNKSPQQFADTLNGITGTLTTIGDAMVGLSNVVNGFVGAIRPVANMVGGWPNLIQDTIIAWGAWKVLPLLTGLGQVSTALGVGIPAAAATASGAVTAAATTADGAMLGLAATLGTVLGRLTSIAAVALPAWMAANDQDNARKKAGEDPYSGMGFWDQGKQMLYDNFNFNDIGGPNISQWLGLPNPNGKPKPPPGQPDVKWPSGAWGNKPWATPGMKPWQTPWSPYAVPGVPGKGGVGKDKAETPFDPSFAAPPRPGETEQEYSAEGALLTAKHRLEEDRKTLLNLQQDNNATAQEKQAAENKLAEDQREIYEAQLRLTTAQQDAYKSQLKGLKDADEMFDNIDQDFGLSKGLPGLVKNLVGFLGDLAAAPMLGQLKAITTATGTDKNTFGMLGIMGQQNLAAGRSPLGFGAAPAGYGIGGPGASGQAGGVVIPGSGGVPLIRNPDGTITSPNPSWAHLINRESGGRNVRQGIIDANSGGNEAEGYFQITPRTWAAHGGGAFAPNPLAASPEQQAAIAARILQGNPSGSDWGAGLPGRESAGGLLAGLGGGPTQPAWGPNSTMNTDANGGVLSNPASFGAPGGAAPNWHAQTAGFGRPDPNGFSSDGPMSPIGPPRGGGWQPSGGGGANGVGGLPLAAMMTAASAFPGGGAAAATAMQLINRTIGFGQQAAAIGIQGLMDTFKISSPDDDGGKSDLSQGWAGRVLAGFAGARPATPGSAGQAPQAKKDSNPSKDPSGKDALGQGGDSHDNSQYGAGSIINHGQLTINGQPQQQGGMQGTNAGLSAQSSAPATTSFGGFI